METANGLWTSDAVSHFNPIPEQQQHSKHYIEKVRNTIIVELLERKYLIEIFLSHWACGCCQTHICRIFINHCYCVRRSEWGVCSKWRIAACLFELFHFNFDPIEFCIVNGRARKNHRLLSSVCVFFFYDWIIGVNHIYAKSQVEMYHSNGPMARTRKTAAN